MAEAEWVEQYLYIFFIRHLYGQFTSYVASIVRASEVEKFIIIIPPPPSSSFRTGWDPRSGIQARRSRIVTPPPPLSFRPKWNGVEESGLPPTTYYPLLTPKCHSDPIRLSPRVNSVEESYNKESYYKISPFQSR